MRPKRPAAHILTTECQFHRAIRGGPMPVAVVQARLRGESLAGGLPSHWKFYQQ